MDLKLKISPNGRFRKEMCIRVKHETGNLNPMVEADVGFFV